MQRSLYETTILLGQFNDSALRWGPLIASWKLRLREIKQLAQDHIVNGRLEIQIQDFEFRVCAANRCVYQTGYLIKWKAEIKEN